jgi:hypothetical protein
MGWLHDAWFCVVIAAIYIQRRIANYGGDPLLEPVPTRQETDTDSSSHSDALSDASLASSHSSLSPPLRVVECECEGADDCCDRCDATADERPHALALANTLKQ